MNRKPKASFDEVVCALNGFPFQLQAASYYTFALSQPNATVAISLQRPNTPNETSEQECGLESLHNRILYATTLACGKARGAPLAVVDEKSLNLAANALRSIVRSAGLMPTEVATVFLAS
jgi:hypothetical protein